MNRSLDELLIENSHSADQKYSWDNWLKDDDTKKMWIKYLRKA